METLLAIGAVQSLFLALVIFTKKYKTASDQVLIFVLFIWALRFFSYWAVQMNYHVYLPRLIGIEQSFFMLDGPLLLVYVSSLTEEDRFKAWAYWGHFLPFFTVLLYAVFLFYDSSEAEVLERFGDKLQSLQRSRSGNLRYDERFFILVVCLSLLYYGLASLSLVRKYRLRIKASFSYTEKITLDWLRMVVISWVLFFAMPLMIFLINFYTEWLPLYLTDLPLVFGFLIMIFIPAYYAFRQLNNRTLSLEMNNQQILQEESQDSAKNLETNPSNSYKKSGLKEEQALAYQNRLQSFMEQEKPYLNADLTLSILAEALKISPNHLSQVLNERLNRNFFDFVNEYRVEEVKKRLNSPEFKHYTLFAIAEDCGFKSKSSFNSIFKKFTEMTPSEYKGKIGEGN